RLFPFHHRWSNGDHRQKRSRQNEFAVPGLIAVLLFGSLLIRNSLSAVRLVRFTLTYERAAPTRRNAATRSAGPRQNCYRLSLLRHRPVAFPNCATPATGFLATIFDKFFKA